MRGDRLAFKLLALDGVLARAVIAGHRRTQSAPADAVARLIQARQRRLQAVSAGQQIMRRNAYVREIQARRNRSAQRKLALDIGGGAAGPSLLSPQSPQLTPQAF